MANTPSTPLVDVADPPVSGRSSPVQEKAVVEKLKTSLAALGIGVALVAAAWWLWRHGLTLYGVVAGAVGLFAIVAAASGSTLRASCPYCSAEIDTILDRKEGRQVRCPTCSEYSTVNAGLLRPLDPATVAEVPRFESPVFRGAAWPNACVACGGAPVRFDDLSKTTVGVTEAVLGHLKVVHGSVKGIPYCNEHRDGVSLKVGALDKNLYLCWTSLRMMRRYLAANRKRATY